MSYTRYIRPCLPGIALSLLLTGASAASVPGIQAMSSEDFLNHLGVNTHLNGLTRNDPWNTNAAQVAAQLSYLGVRLDRDWAWSEADGKRWNSVQEGWGLGRFWTSIDEGSPARQRKYLQAVESIWTNYPGLIYAVGGPNEEDDAYPQKQGATLPDSALVQSALYAWARPRNILVSQMEFGAGWTAANSWQGDYNPTNTGVHQNYTPGPADLGGAHSYISAPGQRPVAILKALRQHAEMVTPGKPVAHTEVGAYYGAKLPTTVYGQYMVMGAFDSAAAGDAAYIVYGLQRSDLEECYGFFKYPEGTAYPVAEYYHSMTTLLSSPQGSYGPGAMPTFKPGSLDVSFSNTATSHLLLQKPTGEFVIADWSEQVMDERAHVESDGIDFGRQFASVYVYDIERGEAPIAALTNASRCSLSLYPGDVYLIELK